MKRPRVSGLEQDAFSRKWKNYLAWRPGERKDIKARANRRERRKVRQLMRGDLDD